MKISKLLFCIVLVPLFGLMSTGCATSGTSLATTEPALTVPNKNPVPEADREAILGMVGGFDVSFQFDETVALAEDYEPTDPKLDGARELVILVEDTGDHIVLQHLLLVAGGQVIKHWRQDWTWEATHRFEFSDELTWDYVALDEALTQGSWTQCVYGVVDTPRYCGTGDWNHRYGQPTWTSDRSWRPLPRRDYTIRDDYNALNVENRHTITPTGWTHEQDNTKVIRTPGEPSVSLVREFGFNDYRVDDTIDFSAAYHYWQETQTFWALVRDEWDRALATGQIRVNGTVDGEPLISRLFELADQYREDSHQVASAVDTIFDRYIDTGPPRYLADTN
ncbi:MAG TPA: DUF6607 family protein [Wenzhouxiangella sp.]